MSRSKSQRSNAHNKWKKIQDQFKDRMMEKTPSGASPSSSSIIASLAQDWCCSPHTIEAILRKDLTLF